MDCCIKYTFLAILLLALVWGLVTGNSFSQVGDIIVFDKNGLIHCDKIVCPHDTDRCEVSKITDSKNTGTIIRSNECWAANGTILKMETFHEKNPIPGNIVNIHVTGGGSGNIIFNRFGPDNLNVPTFPPGFPFHNQQFPVPTFPPGFPFHNGGFYRFPQFPPGFPFYN